jgi:hypothetical protein
MKTRFTRPTQSAASAWDAAPVPSLADDRLVRERRANRCHGVLCGARESFKEFPPRQKAASFAVDQIVEKVMARLVTSARTADYD